MTGTVYGARNQFLPAAGVRVGRHRRTSTSDGTGELSGRGVDLPSGSEDPPASLMGLPGELAVTELSSRASRVGRHRRPGDETGAHPVMARQAVTGIGAVGVVVRPTDGLELYGEYQGCGFKQPQYLVRRGDGQVLQMSRLLYLVTAAIDGRRGEGEIAAQVTRSFGRTVSAENVDYLIRNRLRPLGVVSADSGPDSDSGTVESPRSDPLLALTAKRVLFPARLVARIARTVAWLHHPAAVVAVLAGLITFDAWLFGQAHVVTAAIDVLGRPLLLLAVLGLALASLVFHEFGHASACHYSGARPGNIGCGMFLVWPALYTDVTDVYRANRAGRLRTDLGGVYFNVIYVLAMAACYGASGSAVFLLAAFVVHLEILQQLVPVVRLDGYFILGDLAGVPDLFGRIRPILLSVVRRGRSGQQVSDLKRSTRIVVTAWVAAICPILVGNFVYAIWNLPRILRVGVRSVDGQLEAVARFWATGSYAGVAVSVISLVLLALPSVGLVYLLARVAKRLLTLATAGTARRPGLRGVAVAVAGLVVGGTIAGWVVLGQL